MATTIKIPAPLPVAGPQQEGADPTEGATDSKLDILIQLNRAQTKLLAMLVEEATGQPVEIVELDEIDQEEI